MKRVLSIATVLVVAIGLVVTAIALIRTRASLAGDSVTPPESRSRPETVTDDSAEVAANLPLFYRLDEHYIRGSEPAFGGVVTLAELGIKTIVDLRSKYDHTNHVKDAAESLGIGYQWLPMSVWNPPSDEEANEFVRLVTTRSKGPFFVFCADGMHRTGEMSAIYRVAHSRWSVEKALEEMDEVGFNPYYYTLRNYVWTYARKFNPSAVPPKGRKLNELERWD